MTKKELDQLTFKVLGCCIEVHKILGPGLLESVYEKCLAIEFKLQGINFIRQINVPMDYKGHEFETELRLDFLVEDILCLELKAIEGVLPIHEAILLSYMEMLKKPKGLMVNFHTLNIMQYGQKTFVNQYFRLMDEGQ